MAEEHKARPLLSILLDGAIQLGTQALRERWSAVQAQWASERDHLLKVLVRSALALMLMGLGLILLIAWVLVVCWEVCGPQLLAGLGVVLLGLGAWLLDRTRMQMKLASGRKN
jgi:ABC-type nitrate/sulfonate/bicarbonate transport system permease component